MRLTARGRIYALAAAVLGGVSLLVGLRDFLYLVVFVAALVCVGVVYVLLQPVMARYAQSFIEAIPGGNTRSLVLEVRKSIYLLLPMGRANIGQIAQTLGMNVRTLQRRLDEDGETFSNLINTVRIELSQRYISNPKYPLGRIAELLGYSNHSAFTRWFTSQFKQAPQEVRAQNINLLLL